jgi:6-phosphogluconolactonase
MTKSQHLHLGFPVDSLVYHPTYQLLYTVDLKPQAGKKAPGIIWKVQADKSLSDPQKINFAHGYSYISLDRTGNYLLGASYFEGYIDSYQLDGKGIPGKLVSSIDPGRDKAHAILTSPDNKFAYVPFVKEQNGLFQFGFDSETGKLTSLKPTSFTPENKTGPRHYAYHPYLPVIYFSNEQQVGVSVYQMCANGTLTLLQVCNVEPTPAGIEHSASGIALTTNGKFLFTGQRGGKQGDNAINRFEVLDDGSIKHLGKTSTDNMPWGLTLDPENKFLFVSCTVEGTLCAYELDQLGDLKLITKLPWEKDIRDVLVFKIP